MDLYLKITSGPRVNDVFRLQAAITIGRSKSDINIKDSKASATHAKIIEENGELYYLDLNSTNGSLVAGKEIKKVKLTPGLIISIGATTLEIATEFDVKKNSSKNLSEWRESLYNFTQNLEMTQVSSKLTPFSQCVVVEIKSGVQEGKTWTLGYGPRVLGLMSSDLCLLDESLGDYCLKFSQLGDNVVISTLEDQFFLIDGQKKNTETLKDRLSILIGNTLLEVGFLK